MHTRTCVRSDYSDCRQNDEQLASAALGKGAQVHLIHHRVGVLYTCREMFVSRLLHSLGHAPPLVAAIALCVQVSPVEIHPDTETNRDTYNNFGNLMLRYRPERGFLVARDGNLLINTQETIPDIPSTQYHDGAPLAKPA